MRRAHVRLQGWTFITDDSALHVVAHARRAASRGRQPSMPYKGETNPRRAYALALREVGTRDEVEFRRSRIAIAVHRSDDRVVRYWVHVMRGRLRARGVVIDLPQPYDARAVESILPRLCTVAVSMDVPLGRMPQRVRCMVTSIKAPSWFDNVHANPTATLNKSTLVGDDGPLSFADHRDQLLEWWRPGI